MTQHCYLVAVWLTWLGLPLVALLVGLRAGWSAAVLVLLAGVIGQVLYLRWFPRISRWVGYGSVDDVPAAPDAVPAGVPRVTLYTANLCPFCPIVRRRLDDLRQQRAFELEEVDVTFRPEIIRSKGLRSVPVVEAGGRHLVGNTTSEQLAAFLREAAGGGPA